MKVAIFGATGVTGRAAAEQFATAPGWAVVGLSRRPVDVPDVVHVPLDLTDSSASAAVLRSDALAGTTHVVYAALQESADLVSGWSAPELIERNTAMFRHALEPLLMSPGAAVQHVSLLQGGKAYGLHLGKVPIPAKERSPRESHENFYFRQEDALRALAATHGFGWTIFRPPPVYGRSFGSPMNVLPAIGVYAAVLQERGEALSFPGGPPRTHEAVDARLLARALHWAATSSSARNEIFNIANGDVFDWHDVWPTIADAFAMDVGAPSTQSLAATMPGQARVWADIVDRRHLRSPRDLSAFVGSAWIYADMLFGGGRPASGPSALLSTVKLRQAGFTDCIDTEDMFREWFARLQSEQLLPPRAGARS